MTLSTIDLVVVIIYAIGIFGLFVRRFFVRPRWLGQKVSYESGIIAALIFILMVIFLPQGLLGFARRWLNR